MPETAGSPEINSSGYLPGSAEYRRVMVALFAAGVATFVLLYDTQALLPAFVAEFEISPAQSTLTVSLATGSLALALFVAGPLAERVGRTRMIHLSLGLSTVIAAACALAPTWQILLALRTFSGVALAGLLSVATAYLREEVHPQVQARATGLYIGGTALGGMIGRLLTAPIADLAGWRWALGAAALLALASTVLVALLLPPSGNFVPRPLPPRKLVRMTRAALTEPALLSLYLLGACSMGALIATFNALGFRLTAEPMGMSLAAISLVYLAYALGSVSSAISGVLADRFGRRAVTPSGVLIALAGVVATSADSLVLIVIGIACLVVGFFIVHGIASGWVTARAAYTGVSATQAAALYLSAYYLGSSIFGTLGSTAWTHYQWPGVVALSGGLLLVCAALILTLRRIPSKLPPPLPNLTP